MTKPLYTLTNNAQVCAVCGREFALFSGSVVSHGRAHVRKGEAIERPIITARDLRAPATRFEVR